MSKVILRDLASVQECANCAPSHAEFVYGEIAFDALGHATAEEMLTVLRGHMPASAAKKVVGLLLDHGLLFDTVIDDEVGR